MKRTLARGILTISLLGCQAPAPEDDTSEDGGSKSSTFVSASGSKGKSAPKKVKIPLRVKYGTFGLAGTDATAYSVSLAGCVSGYTATVTEADVDGIEAYKDDRSCLAKLTSFTTNGVVYNNTNTNKVDFTTWVANDTALFANAGGDTIRVKVISQLPTPIAGTETVVYNFSELLDGDDDTIGEASVSDPHAITVQSQQAPLFKMHTASYISMDDTSGAPELQFKMECVDDPTSGAPTSVAMTDGSATRTLCGLNDLNSITYKLVKDTYGDVLTISQAEAIFSTAGTSITIPTDQYHTDATHDGFNTSILDGPGAIGTAGNEHMLLVLKAGLSFTYYNVDITTITQ